MILFRPSFIIILQVLHVVKFIPRDNIQRRCCSKEEGAGEGTGPTAGAGSEQEQEQGQEGDGEREEQEQEREEEQEEGLILP